MGNSVIYRPAYDAEVEYLESTGTQWIDTGIVPTENTRVVAKLYTEQDANKNWFGSQVFVATNYEGYALNYNINGVIDYVFGNSGWRTVSASYSLLNRVFEIDYSNVALKVDEVTLTTSLCSEFPTLTKSMLIFWRTGTPESSRTAGRVYYFKIYSGSTLVRDFIPVRIGSVGYLYDKVTKQLFANKGTGNFILGNDVSNAVIPQQRCVLYFGSQRSVGFDRIYEEYEWLKAICPVNKTMMTLPIESQNFNWEVKIEQLGNINYIRSDNYSYYTATDTAKIVYIWDIPNKVIIFSAQTARTEGMIVNISSTSESLTFNGEIIPKYGFQNVKYRITNANNGVRDAITYVSSITIDGVDRYIPVKLLQSIPAILDANGIARQAGECGMWDKVSNKFYGNVASSGTFTVKNPKCYEEYKWLKVSVSINVDMAALPVDSTNLYFKHKHISGKNYHYFRTTGDGVDYDYYYATDTSRCAIWNISDRTVVYKNHDITEDEIVINCNSSNRNFNGYDIPIYGSTIKQVSIISREHNGFEGLTSSITVDGSVRYVPCKLTHGIPASMDANGIARPAGTCGMWDKVNDKFYGNVASSGTFTVSND